MHLLPFPNSLAQDLQVFEPYLVKTQTIKTAIESACMILRIDDIVSGVTSSREGTQEIFSIPPSSFSFSLF